MKTFKKFLPAVLSCTLIATSLTPAFAGETASEKEEVIYINLTADGSVKDIYAVNIFGKGDITDYGDYSSIEILNTKDKISLDGGKINFTSSTDRIYCKGKMNDAVSPWNISIRYYIDGTEYSADEVAGKSGALEIRFQVTENKSYTGNFFDDYAMQASFTLDTEICSNIKADNATTANVGRKKQISYTMLPGEGIDTVITADVTDFEMDAVSINGIPLSLNIEVDDEELMNQVTELMDAVETLNDGAQGLKNGADELKSGGNTVNTAIDSLAEGADTLYDGVKKLNDGVIMLQTGLTELNMKSSELTTGSAEIQKALLAIQKELSMVSASAEQLDILVSGSSQIKAGIESLLAGVTALQNNTSFNVFKKYTQSQGLDIDELQAGNLQTIMLLNGQVASLNEQIALLEEMNGDASQIAKLKETVEQLNGIIKLLKGNYAAIDGVDVYLTQINAGIGELAAGINELKANYEILDSGITSLAMQTKVLLVNMTELKTAIDTLVKEYGKLDGGINEYTKGVAQIAAGYSEIVNGTGSLLNGSNDLKNGSAELFDKYGEFMDGIVKLYDGTVELKDGTDEMYDETKDIDDKISDKIDEMLESITGGNKETVSYVSEKNTNVESVQFVFRTESVAIEEPEAPAPEPAKKQNFWQKLLNLFRE